MSFRWPLIARLFAAVAMLAAPGARADDQVKPSEPTMVQLIEAQVALGSRAVGTVGHAREIDLIERQLRSLGLSPQRQQWSEPIGGKAVGFTNIIASVSPEARRRIILATHFDTVARAYRDTSAPDAVMPGANNGASGVAVLLELARRLSVLKTRDFGVDFVFFDGEEGPLSLGGGDRHWRAIGSPHFVGAIPAVYAGKKITDVIVFDMVCYSKAVFRPETSSVENSTRAVEKFWEVGVEEHPTAFSFDPLPYAVDDDHTAFMRAGLPAFLVIGFEYEPWYDTALDTPDKCSAGVLGAVVDTTIRYMAKVDR